MIKNLKGIHETVGFENGSTIMLYNNDVTGDYPLHWHTPLEIIMPVNSTYTAVCNNTTYYIADGDLLIIAPGTLHRLSTPNEGRRYIFQADISFLNQIKEFESTISWLSPTTLIAKENTPQLHKKLQKIFLDIVKEHEGKNLLSEAAVYSKLIQFFITISRSHLDKHETNDTPSKQQEYLQKFMFVCDYINTHCTEDLTLDEAAALAGFSKYHFTRLFKQYTSHSFYKYLNLKRIALAEKVLINPECSITEAATSCGFNSISSFIRMFKLCKNCTPTEFRNMYRL